VYLAGVLVCVASNAGLHNADCAPVSVAFKLPAYIRICDHVSADAALICPEKITSAAGAWYALLQISAWKSEQQPLG
jgi:hypothetical protein